MSRVRNMTIGSPIKLILAVAFPLMLGNVFQQLYTVVDAQVVGRFNGVDALAALGASDWFSWVYLGIIQGIAQGFAVPMAQAFGADDHAELRRCVGNAVILALINALLITCIALLSINPVLNMLETPQSIRPMSKTYLTILFCGYPFTMAYNLMAGILRSLGDGRSPLFAMIVASLTNIALDIIFVAFFGWGVAGAAAATVIAQGASCAFCLLRLKKIDFIKPSRNDLKLHLPTAARLMKLGLPGAGQNALIGIGGMILQRIVNGMGVAFIAGYTASNKLYGVLEIAAISYGYSMTTYAGQNLGAKKMRRVQKGVHAAAVTGVITAVIICVFMFLFGRQITSSFISGEAAQTEEACRIAWEYLRLMSLWLPILYILHIYRAALQGLGLPIAPMLSGLAEFIMRTGAALILPGIIGYSGVFWAEVLAWAGADVILVTSYYASYARLRRQIPEN